MMEKVFGKHRRGMLLWALLVITMAWGCEKHDVQEKSTGLSDGRSVSSGKHSEGDYLAMDFEEIERLGRNTTVRFYGWGGDPKTNAWVEQELAPFVEKAYGIRLERVGMDIDKILALMTDEKAAGTSPRTVDLVWINGENFYTARHNDLLFGPFVDKLPNWSRYMDAKSKANTMDFGYPTDGFEAPYGRAQMVYMYDEETIPSPPTTPDALLAWAKAHPGRFAYAELPDFTASAFVRNMIALLDGYEGLRDVVRTKEAVREKIPKTIAFFRELKPFLWRKGETYPADTPTLTGMFEDREVDFAMSYSPNEASGNIATGRFPKTVRTFLFDGGTLGNTNFVAIGKDAANIPGAMLVANAILSPEMQASKYNPDGWGSLPVTDFSRLDQEEKALFTQYVLPASTIAQDVLSAHFIPELPADLVPIIEEIWREAMR